MGTSTSSLSIFTEDLLDEYATLTYLSRYEILNFRHFRFDRKLLQNFVVDFKLYKIFSGLGLDQVDDINNYRVPVAVVQEIFPQLKFNPFKDRIFRVFSSLKDERFSFEDMLDLCSVMSESCPANVKATWAFRIFDYDEDGSLNEKDLMTVIDMLTNRDVIQNEEKKIIVRTLLEDMDIEANGTISLLEFQHVIGRMSDFPVAFCFRL